VSHAYHKITYAEAMQIDPIVTQEICVYKQLASTLQ
jgi:hypothetical protein